MITFSCNERDWLGNEDKSRFYSEKAERDRWILSVYESCDKSTYYSKDKRTKLSRDEEISNRIFAGFLTRGIENSSNIVHPDWLKKHEKHENKFHYDSLPDETCIDGFIYDNAPKSVSETESPEHVLIVKDACKELLELFDEYAHYSVLYRGKNSYNPYRRLINFTSLNMIAIELQKFFNYLKVEHSIDIYEYLENNVLLHILSNMVQTIGLMSNYIYLEKGKHVELTPDEVEFEAELRLEYLNNLKDKLYMEYGYKDYEEVGVEPPTEYIEKLKEIQREKKKERDRKYYKAQ